MISVEEEYSKHLTFSKIGTGYERAAYCPIHGEVPGQSTPSMYINLSTGQWFCFSRCGGGSLSTFLVKMKKKPDIIKKIVDNVKMVKAVRKIRKQEEFLPYAMLGLFDNCPTELTDAGFDEDVLAEHNVGYDMDKYRITYPILNRDDRLMAVVGRRQDTTFGKYLPYTEQELLGIGIANVPVYVKGSTFWREDIYFREGRHLNRHEPIILVEGFKAALWLVQHGFRNVLAILGNHVTDFHVLELQRMGKDVISLLDGNLAGYKGTLKIRHKLKGTNRVLACIYPEGADQPDDILDVDILRHTVENPLSISRYKRVMNTRLNIQRR